MKKYKHLKDIINFSKKATVSVVGSGGKTTFCKMLADELYSINKNKVLLTTTTKMQAIFDDKIKSFILEDENLLDLKKLIKSNGLYFIVKKYQNKCSSLELDILSKLIEDFDYAVIEADGSKRKPLKLNRAFEPVYVKNTTHSVGIIPINALGLEIREEYIHNINLLQGISAKKVDINFLIYLIKNEIGLFKDSGANKKILLINQADNKFLLNKAKLLAKKIKKLNLVDYILICSLKNRDFYLYWSKNENNRGNTSSRSFKKNGRK